MKKKSFFLFVSLFFLSLMFSACNRSTKGNWSESDKQKFREDMQKVDELSNFGENKTKWIECYLDKCEATFNSYKDADMDAEGCKKLALECNKDILSNGSVKGKWSESDKQKFRQDMQNIEELSDLGENKTKWIECYLSKCEANFSSYYEADNDESGCEKLALECNDELQK